MVPETVVTAYALPVKITINATTRTDNSLTLIPFTLPPFRQSVDLVGEDNLWAVSIALLLKISAMLITKKQRKARVIN